MTEVTYFVHKQSNQRTKGVPLSAMLQCREPLEGNENFVLYQSLDGHGFFLRKCNEFAERFKAVSEKGKNTVWTHKEKGGTYQVVNGTVMYVGSPSLGQIMDGHEMKAYFMDGNCVKTMLFCPATQFGREFEARGVVKMNFHTPDAAKFKATRSQIETQIAAAVKKANNRADHPYVYVSEHAIPVPKWSNIMPPKSLPAEDGFITVWYAEPFHVALVSRHDKKDVRIRGDNLAEVMKAAELVLWSKQ